MVGDDDTPVNGRRDWVSEVLIIGERVACLELMALWRESLWLGFASANSGMRRCASCQLFTQSS